MKHAKQIRSFFRIKFLFFVSLIFMVEVLPAQNSGASHPSFEPSFLVDSILGSKEKKVYSADELFKISLLFSECPLESETAARCLKKFEKIKADVTSDSFMSLGLEERGRAILKYLYQDYLSKYDFNQTRLDVALETGVYNCVSSGLLYTAAAKAAGLDVRGQKTTQHAFCTLYIPSQKAGQFTKIDIETTNPYGFNPGTREEIENADNIKKYYVVPKKYYSNREEVSDGVFAGLIGANICSACLKSGDYARAVPLGAARYEAVRFETSNAVITVRQELDITASNYINKDYNTAAPIYDLLIWYTDFIDRWGMTDYLQKNMDNIFYNLIVYCSKEKNYSLAEKSYSQFKAYSTKKQLSKIEEIIADTLISSRIDGKTNPEKIEILNELMSSENYLSASIKKRGELYLENAWIGILNEYMNKKVFYDGYEKSEEALLQLPKSTKIKNMRQNFYNNCIAIIHNEFAKEANAGNNEKALQLLNTGLRLFPDDKTLKKDLSTFQKMISQ